MSLRTLVKSLLDVPLRLVSNWTGYTFPSKYGVRWKLRVLLSSYEPETTRLLRQVIRPGQTVIDIGAHIGYFTRLAARQTGKSGRVIAFEADSENFKFLEHNTKRFDNVVREQRAIGDTKGTISFYHVRGSTGCHSTVPQENSEHYEVPATTLDTYCSEHDIGVVDVIKMDIEGGEWKALQGMSTILNQEHLQLVFEYNPEALERAGIVPKEILALLHEHGFALYALAATQHEITADTFDSMHAYLGAEGSVNVYAVK